MLAATSGRPRRWRRALVLAAAGVLVTGGGLLAWWTSRPPAFHEPAGVSALAREIADAVPASLREHDVPGASVAVVRRGEVRDVFDKLLRQHPDVRRGREVGHLVEPATAPLGGRRLGRWFAAVDDEHVCRLAICGEEVPEVRLDDDHGLVPHLRPEASGVT